MRMKASFLRRPPGPLSRAAARNAALLNQCATPGLGSLMAGRLLPGLGQLLLAVAGFVMVIAWFVLHALQLYNELVNDAQPKSVAWLGEAGALTFTAAWLWSLVTSLSVLREARANEGKPPPRT
jgi:fatty acid desaturase